ncbi:MAG TPA: ABC transporter ATP-binding protein [Candidatus Acidoferrum sp.]|nr:ABC transporter ATP-binding protein [Candidatus Acidoferrum sp.]
MISLENVTKEYDLPTGKAGQLVAADRLTLQVPAGEVFGLVGPNGAGKTTTLKMVCGLMLPTAGRITVNNIDVERDAEEAQRYIGYLADFFSVYDDLKAWEYVEHFALAYKLEPAKVRERVKEVIALMGLESKYDAMVGGLSRGMKQRLGIARGIVHDPPLLVLDEPASGLDPKARLELKELIRRLNREGKTVFITSHVLSDLEEICTSLAIMEKGKLLRVGKIGDVMRGAGRTKRVRIKLAAPGFALGTWLAGRPGVSEVKEAGLEAEMAFPGTDAELAALVRDAVTAGAPICCVEEKVETLEALFSRLSSGEVM